MSTLTVPQSGVRHTVRAIARLTLPLMLLAPTLVLFALLRQSTGDDVEFATAERHGVAYLQALGPLEIALTNAEAAAVTGAPVAREQLTTAVDATSRVDDQYGAELRVHDRWTDLRAKIQGVPTSGTAAALLTAYGETTDLLLDLIEKVRNTSNLVRDPHSDTYYLEDGAAQELPEAIVAATRYTSLAARAAGLPASEQVSALIDLSTTGSGLASNARDLSGDIQLASEGTGSRSLGATLLTKIDGFNRAIDALIPSTALVQGNGPAVDLAQIVKARGEVQTAAAELSAALLTEIDELLRSRLSDLGLRRDITFAALAVAVLLALIIPVSGVISALRRRRSPGHGPARGGPPAGRSAADDVALEPRDDRPTAGRRRLAEQASEVRFEDRERSRAAR